MEECKFPGYRKLSIRELQLLQLGVIKELHEFCVAHNIKYYIIAGTLLGAVRHGGFIPWDDDIDIAMMRDDYEKFKQSFSQELDNNKYFLQHYESDVDYRPALMRVCIKNTILDLEKFRNLKCCKNTFLDIFPLDNVPDSIANRKSQAKAIKRIGNLINYRLCSDFQCQNKFREFVKKHLIHDSLTLLPLSFFQRRKVSLMTKYDNTETKCVASMESHYSYDKQTMPREIYGTPVLLKFEDTELYAPQDYNDYLEHLYGKNYMQLPPAAKRKASTDVYIKI